MSLRRLTISDEKIYQEIYDAIVENRLAPGSKLSQDELAEIFGVSKTRVRPILFRLAEQGIVSLEPNRGAFVAKPSMVEVQQVLSARILLEEGLVRRIVHQITPEQLQQLRDIVLQEQRAREKNELAEAHRCAGRFHIVLAELSGNEVLVELVRMLISRNAIGIAMYQSTVGACSIDDHMEMIEALGSGDEKRAVETTVKHLQHIAQSLDEGKPNRLRGGLFDAFNLV